MDDMNKKERQTPQREDVSGNVKKTAAELERWAEETEQLAAGITAFLQKSGRIREHGTGEVYGPDADGEKILEEISASLQRTRAAMDEVKKDGEQREDAPV